MRFILRAMPKSNTQLLIEAFAANESGDQEALRELMDPEIEIYAEPGMINSGRYSGWDGWIEWTSQWNDAWEEISYEPLEFIEVGDSVVVAPTRVVGRGAGSGVEIDRVFGYLYELRDGKGIRFHTYGSKERALEVAEELAGAER
jgi:ketosteroid isomerase-like protein